MAYLLYQDIDDFQKYVGGAANESVELESLEPYMHLVAEDEIIPFLGRPLWILLMAAVETNPIPAGPLKDLLPYVSRPLAFLTLHAYTDVGAIQLSQAGMVRTESETVKSAFKYQEANYRERMLRSGYQALEHLQRFIDSRNATTDPAPYAWDDAAKNRARGLVINYASELKEAYSKSVSRYTYEMLRSLIPDLELFALVPNIGLLQYNDLKAKILAADLSDKNKEFLKIIQRVIGNFVIEEAVRRHWVSVDGAEVIQFVQRSIDGKQQRLPAPSGHEASLKISQAKEFANRWLSYLSCWLDENNEAEEFELYRTWKAEQEAAVLEEAATAERSTSDTDTYGPASDTGGVTLL